LVLELFGQEEAVFSKASDEVFVSGEYCRFVECRDCKVFITLSMLVFRTTFEHSAVLRTLSLSLSLYLCVSTISTGSCFQQVN
jgi:hypothetical protein